MIKFSEMISENINNQSVPKLGLDVHGVIDAMPDFFAFLTDAFIKNGGEVHILTGGHWNEEFEKQLNDWGIKFTHKFSVYDHLIECFSEFGEFIISSFICLERMIPLRDAFCDIL